MARNARNPDGVVRIGANAVGRVLEFGPDATAGKHAVLDHLEGDELLRVRIGDHERAAGVDQRHAVRPRQAIGDLALAAVVFGLALAATQIRPSLAESPSGIEGA